MELEYVLKAIRRYWYIVAIFVVAGLLAGSALTPEAETRYEATALVLVAPSSNGGQAGDRFVASQVVVLQSPQLAAGAAELAEADDVTADEARRSVTFEQRPGSDVVEIVASSPDPERAQAIANGYVDAYFAVLEQQADTGQINEELEALERSIDRIEEDIRLADEEIAEVLAPFLLAGDGDGGPGQVPALEQIAPALATERQILGGQYTELLRRRTDLQFTARPEIRSEVLQRAELPVEPVDTSSRLLLVAFPFAGIFLGVLAATVVARTSRRVLDDVEVSETLGEPIAATVTAPWSFKRHSLERPEDVPARMRNAINHLCVQAERRAVPGTTMAVVVAGSQAKSGASSVATVMAHRYAEAGSKVLLVHADHAGGGVSRQFDVGADGLTALGDRTGTEADGHDAVEPLSADDITAAPISNLVVAHPAGTSAPASPHSRLDVAEMMDAARKYVDVVIFDSGQILESISSAKLARFADVTVLVVPVRRQHRRPLVAIARQLAEREGLLIPVTTRGFGRRRASHVDGGRGPEVESEPGRVSSEEGERAWADPGRAGTEPTRTP
jgi:Mrp family chromosome partitioning ATPase